MRRVVSLAAILLSATTLAFGHYRWVHYVGRQGPFTAIPQKFDLNALPDQTVQYFISREGPRVLVPGDNILALASQIRAAAETWNGVPGSAIKLRFGGLADTTAAQATPRIDVVFSDEIPPGVLAQTWPEIPSDLTFLTAQGNSGFVPILRSRLELRSDLTQNAQVSSSDAFFLTMAHEFGHSLGLQHSLTSAVMSTSITRSTNKVSPLAADDLAGLATLYPVPGHLASTGVIEGKVSAGGGGVNLASVVALANDGSAIGGMTQPDGTYRIEGLPPGEYRVYAHPLPPAQFGETTPAGIAPPRDLAGAVFPASAGFATQFFPGTQDWTQASLIAVAAGQTVGDVTFTLPSRATPGVHSMRTFAYLGEPGPVVPVQTPPLVSGDRRYLVLQAPGTLVQGTTLAPGLQVSVMGGPAFLEQDTLQYWQDDFLLIMANAGEVEKATPISLAVTTGNDLYVLPAAFSVVPTQHPQILWVNSSSEGPGKGFAEIAGVNVGKDTKVYFDGIPAFSVGVNQNTTLRAEAPPAIGAYEAKIEVASASGQTSWQVSSGQGLPVFQYADGPLPSVQVSPGSLTAGTNAMVRIDGIFTNFRQDLTVVGFGTSDIAVRQMWVLSPTSVVMNVSVSPSIKTGTVRVTVATGLQMVSTQTVIEIHAADPKISNVRIPMINPDTGLSGVSPGGQFLVEVPGIPVNLAGWSVLVGGQEAPFSRNQDGTLLVNLPAGVPVGAAVVEVHPGQGGPVIPPVLMQIDELPPFIVAVTNSSYVSTEQGYQVRAGDRVFVLVIGLSGGDGGSASAESVQFRLGNLRLPATAVTSGGLFPVTWVELQVPAGAASVETQVLRIGRGTRISNPWPILVGDKLPE